MDIANLEDNLVILLDLAKALSGEEQAEVGDCNLRLPSAVHQTCDAFSLPSQATIKCFYNAFIFADSLPLNAN